MTSLERRALLDVIREFKPPEISELDAALNVIASHAAMINSLLREIKTLRLKIKTEIDSLKEDTL
jgi:hypothetical protein